jgi:5-methylcytosine-specific restriction endonuclease McrA
MGYSRAWPKGESTWTWTTKIRPSILERDGHLCQLRIPGKCTTIATQVHHTADRLLVGDDPDYLVAACRPCNNQIGDPTRPRKSTQRLLNHTVIVDPHSI